MSRRERYRLDFRALMTQCEENYARLLPLMKALGERDSMAVDVGHDLHPHTLQMRVLERSPYTTTVRLEDQELLETLPASRLTVRMYHDARLAEVTEARPFRRVNARYAYPNRNMHQRDEKVQWNRLLAEWVPHLQYHGRDSRQAWPSPVPGR